MSQQRTNHLTCFTRPLPRSSECACAEYDRGGRKASVRGEFTGGDDDVTDLNGNLQMQIGSDPRLALMIFQIALIPEP